MMQNLFFTIIPLSYTITVVVDNINFPHRKEHPPIEKNIFIKLTHLSTQGIFLFNNKLYQQINGVAMGCPLVPTMANFLLGHIETVMLKNSKHLIALKCMLDIWMIFLQFSIIIIHACHFWKF